MNGKGHYAVGASAGVVYAQLAPVTWWQGLLAIPVAAGFSYAAVSPDVDQSKLWHWTDKPVPDEVLGNGGPMQHRGISHFWGVYAAWTALWWLATPRDLWFGLLFALLGAMVTGWWSHLLADAVVGRAGQGRGRGIPLLPWWAHLGLGFKCDGWMEKFLTVAAPIGVLVWTAWRMLPPVAEAWTQIAGGAPWPL